MNQLQEIIDSLKKVMGCNAFYLDTSVQIKQSPHHVTCHLWALKVREDNVLEVMDSREAWYEVEDVDSLVIATIYQRIKTIPLFKNLMVA